MTQPRIRRLPTPEQRVHRALYMRRWRADMAARGITTMLVCAFDGSDERVPTAEYHRRYSRFHRKRMHDYSAARYASDPAGFNEQNRQYRQSLKDAVYARLGGYRCVCCGETEKHFLTIDHVNGGGKQEKKSLGGHGKFYASLLRRPDLSAYRVLCINCNRGRYLNGGECPHKTNVATYEMGAGI
jgi:hypothetical protein